jgi:predicted transcriptional regulator
MDDLALIKSCIADMPRARLAEIASASGVPFFTLLKIRDGHTKNPRYQTVKALAQHLKALEAA